jgi:esterase/lipase superfamily enzyme
LLDTKAAETVQLIMQNAASVVDSDRATGRGVPRGSARPSGIDTEGHTGITIVPVFFGTDRANSGDPDPVRRFTGERGNGKLTFGVANVSIPSSHRVAELEQPVWWRFEFHPDPEKHVVMQSLCILDRASFSAEMKATLTSEGQRDLLLFVHGFNVDFSDAARRAAQLAYDLRFPGPAALYSWPSKAVVRGYGTDESTVEWSTPHFDEFLKILLSEVSAASVDVIAHSMGNRALVNTLAHFDLSALPTGSAYLRNCVLVAPDVDASTFRQLASSICDRSGHCTLYASSRDIPLRVSKLLHGYPRAGDAGTGLVVVDGVDTIDASNVNTALGLGHSYFATTISILRDLRDLIVKGEGPDVRFEIEPFWAMPGKCWRYRE